MKAKKGEFGYISTKKKKMIFLTILMALIGVCIFVVGYFLNNQSKENVFTVIAVLFALPASKFLVGYIVVFPYKSVEEARYQKAVQAKPEGMELYTDLVITSPEKVMNLDFAVVGNKKVICILGKENQDLNYIRKYLSDGVKNWGEGYKVRVVDNEKAFYSELANVSVMEMDEKAKEEEQNVKSFLTSLIV